jgi:hypothetical protein
MVIEQFLMQFLGVGTLHHGDLALVSVSAAAITHIQIDLMNYIIVLINA